MWIRCGYGGAVGLGAGIESVVLRAWTLEMVRALIDLHGAVGFVVEKVGMITLGSVRLGVIVG